MNIFKRWKIGDKSNEAVLRDLLYSKKSKQPLS